MTGNMAQAEKKGDALALSGVEVCVAPTMVGCGAIIALAI
jgi:hypothetical protein